MKNLYNKNYKTLSKEIKKKRTKRYLMFLAWRTKLLKCPYYSKGCMGSVKSLLKSQRHFFDRNKKNNSTIHVEPQKTTESNQSWERKTLNVFQILLHLITRKGKNHNFHITLYAINSRKKMLKMDNYKRVPVMDVSFPRFSFF